MLINVKNILVNKLLKTRKRELLYLTTMISGRYCNLRFFFLNETLTYFISKLWQKCSVLNNLNNEKTEDLALLSVSNTKMHLIVV